MSGNGGGHVSVSTPRSDHTREIVLETAASLVMGDRNKDYAGPKENFAQTADLWSAYLNMKVSAHDVGVLMILVKVARLSTSPGKLDHWIDIAGYAACGAETAPTPVAG